MKDPTQYVNSVLSTVAGTRDAGGRTDQIMRAAELSLQAEQVKAMRDIAFYLGEILNRMKG